MEWLLTNQPSEYRSFLDFTNSSFLKMEEYAKGYAKETEIRQQYTKQRKWLIEKAQIVRSVINSSAIK